MPQFTEMRRPALWDDYRPSGGQPRHGPAAPRTVVVGYDGSPAARRALQRASEAARTGGHVVVVTATQEPEAVAFEPGTGSLAEPSRLLEEAAAELAAHGVQVSTRMEASEPAEALAAAARHVNAALIVVGARGDSYLARARECRLPLFDKLEIDRLFGWLELQAHCFVEPRARQQKRSLECSACSYGIACAFPPERCPMCRREDTWTHSPWRPFTADRGFA
jgi:nucleotide-binding universal stress UspA family protein